MTDSSRLAERLSLWMLGAMTCLPFLVPIHTAPIGTFFPEWAAFALGLAATPLLYRRAGPIRYPRIALLPLLLALIVLLQAVGGRLTYLETGLSALLYLLWVLLLMIVALALRERLGLEEVAGHLAGWLLAGALANAAAAWLSYAGLHSVLLMPHDGRQALYGNIAQTNQFCHHLWLGIASALYLSARGRLPAWAFAAACAILLPAAAYSGSRAGMLYAIAIAAIALRWPGLGSRRRGALIAVAYLAIANLLPLLAGMAPEQAPAGRIAADVAAGGGVRPILFRIGWDMFLRAPLLGLGLGSFPRESFQFGLDLPAWNGHGEHAHNLLAQLLGELGAVAAVGTAAALYYWGRQVDGQRTAPAAAWLTALAAVALIHSMLEYPLWYAHFLGVFAVVLALGDGTARSLELGRTAIAAPVAMGALVAGLLLRDFVALQSLSAPVIVPALSLPASLQARSTALLELRGNSLLKPYVDTAFLATALPTETALAAKADLCRHNLRHQPTAPAVFNCALVYGLAGSGDEARRLWQLANRASPELARDHIKMLGRVLDDRELARLRPVVEAVAGEPLL